MFRTIGDQPSSWETLLPPEVLRLPEELAQVDALLDDPAFFAPFAPYSGATCSTMAPNPVPLIHPSVTRSLPRRGRSG